MASFAAFPVRANLTLSHGGGHGGFRTANIRAGKGTRGCAVGPGPMPFASTETAIGQP